MRSALRFISYSRLFDLLASVRDLGARQSLGEMEKEESGEGKKSLGSLVCRTIDLSREN